MDKSAKLADPERRWFIEPVKVEGKAAKDVIADIVGAVGLAYDVDANGVYLYRVKRSSIENRIYIYKQRLEEAVTVSIDKSPQSDALSAQYGVIAVCEAANVPYNWDKSAKLADPQRRFFIEPVKVESKAAKDAIADIVGSVGLAYDVDENGVYLKK